VGVGCIKIEIGMVRNGLLPVSVSFCNIKACWSVHAVPAPATAAEAAEKSNTFWFETDVARAWKGARTLYSMSRAGWDGAAPLRAHRN
jgi:hypothetical protein